MTQTSTSKPTPDAAGLFPPGRYGRRREARRRPRWMTVSLIVAIVVATSLIAVKLYFEYGNDEFTPNVLKSTVLSDTSIRVTFEVSNSNNTPATCTVQAFAYDQTQVGEAQVPIPSGRDVTVTYTLKTTSRAYVGEVPACQPAQ